MNSPAADGGMCGALIMLEKAIFKSIVILMLQLQENLNQARLEPFPQLQAVPGTVRSSSLAWAA